MATIEEQETVIILNKADLRDGYFRFSTSSKVDWLRLCRRVGGENRLLEVNKHTRQNDKDSKPVETEWLCKVPSEYLSVATFGIRVKKRVTEEQRKAASERMGSLVMKRKKKMGTL